MITQASNKILANHGEAGSKSSPGREYVHCIPHVGFVPPAGEAPAIAVNDPYRGEEGMG